MKRKFAEAQITVALRRVENQGFPHSSVLQFNTCVGFSALFSLTMRSARVVLPIISAASFAH